VGLAGLGLQFPFPSDNGSLPPAERWVPGFGDDMENEHKAIIGEVFTRLNSIII
jgi:hypothetical protein